MMNMHVENVNFVYHRDCTLSRPIAVLLKKSEKQAVLTFPLTSFKLVNSLVFGQLATFI